MELCYCKVTTTTAQLTAVIAPLVPSLRRQAFHNAAIVPLERSRRLRGRSTDCTVEISLLRLVCHSVVIAAGSIAMTTGLSCSDCH